jgi:DinB superfamily
MTAIDTVNTTDAFPDLRYPIGQFTHPASSMAGIRAAHIQTLRLLPERLTAAVAGLDDHQLDTAYREGGWTLRQVVHHVADSHANVYIRMKLALTEDWPVIKPYDEAAWAELADARLPVDVSLDLIVALHARWVFLLESLSDQDFQKGYVHPAVLENGGRQNLAEVLARYDWHSRHHTAHIANLRSRMGW